MFYFIAQFTIWKQFQRSKKISYGQKRLEKAHKKNIHIYDMYFI